MIEIIFHVISLQIFDKSFSIPRFIINFDAFYFYDETHTRDDRAYICHEDTLLDVNGINYPESEWVMTSL